MEDEVQTAKDSLASSKWNRLQSQFTFNVEELKSLTVDIRSKFRQIPPSSSTNTTSGKDRLLPIDEKHAKHRYGATNTNEDDDDDPVPTSTDLQNLQKLQDDMKKILQMLEKLSEQQEQRKDSFHKLQDMMQQWEETQPVQPEQDKVMLVVEDPILEEVERHDFVQSSEVDSAEKVEQRDQKTYRATLCV
eukprot:CAMPEP_0197049190 /NCGR_PEP_ID=MMETSP1384-20130603/24389_1 /TAXON_ID=29189 /ORGANISM="Ammonia sp." /LENGTH=189 /DNA_ID=CAMNT_0042481433 /DNA_START=100 /DNA_END=665 /DNA_ORIENTATION=+